MSALALAAAKADSLELTRLLVDWGADTSRPSWNPPLFSAIERGKVAAAALLLDRGVECEQRETYYGRTPLIAAVEAMEPTLVTSLLQRGADVNARKILGSGVNSELSVGETALIRAAQLDAFGLLCLLLENGADANIAAEFCGDTALMHAIQRRNLRAVERLLDAGADPNATDKRGRRPLDMANDAITYSRRVPVDPRIVERLKEHGARSGA
jgi:ankyrin repeat protein